MAEEHDRLFADLDALTEEQIQVGLAAGVWSEQVRPLVQHYLYDRKLKRVEVAAAHLDEMRDAARVAGEEAVKSGRRHYRGWGNAGSDGSSVRGLSCSCVNGVREGLFARVALQNQTPPLPAGNRVKVAS